MSCIFAHILCCSDNGGSGTAYRVAIFYSFIATCNKADVNPREWMVHHTTEAEHVAAILKSRAKRKATEDETSKEESN